MQDEVYHLRQTTRDQARLISRLYAEVAHLRSAIDRHRAAAQADQGEDGSMRAIENDMALWDVLLRPERGVPDADA
jgi:hypothetical protein